MKFLFVVGVEGSGHFMLRALMQHVISQSYFLNEGEWREIMSRYWDPYYRHKSEFSLLGRMNRNKIKRRWQKIIRQYEKDGISYLMEDMSFPYNHPRNAIRRPDIVDFVDLLEEEVDIKFLALYRNPVSATYSGLRRGFTGNVYEQARIVEDNLIYIDRNLSALGPSWFRVLPFEKFLATPSHYIQGLANWIEVDIELLQKGIANLRSPYPLEDIPGKTQRTLTNFFAPTKTKLWDTLSSNRHTIINDKERS